MTGVPCQLVALGELCHVIGGGTPSKAKPHYYNGDIPWATVRDMRSDVIADTEFKITSAAVAASATNIIPAGNVVIATRVGLGKVCLVERSTAINQDLRGVIPRDANTLSVRYLFWWLKSVANLIESEGTGATVQGVKLPFVKSLRVPIRSIPEQNRIVAILDEAFDGIAVTEANAQSNLRNAHELAAAHLEAAFTSKANGWPERALEDVANIVSGYAFKSADFQPTLGVKSVKITNVGIGEFVADDGNYLPLDFAERYGGFRANAGSIVLALTRTIIAGGLKVAVVPAAYDGALVNQRVAAISPKSGELATAFLFAYLSTRRVAGYVKDRVNTLMQPNLSIADLRALPVPIPEPAVQLAIADQMAKFQLQARALECVYRRKLSALGDLKKSLLHQAFTCQR